MCEFDTQNKLPKKEYIQNAAQLALTDVSAQSVATILGLLTQELAPVIQAYAKAGAALEDHGEPTDFFSSLSDAVETADAVEVAEKTPLFAG